MEPLQIILFSQYSFERFGLAALTFVIFIYLVTRGRTDRTHRFLCYYFIVAFLYEAGHLMTYSIYSPIGAYGWFLAALAPFGVLALIQFAYSFAIDRYRRESLIVLAVTLLISIAVYGEYAYSAIRNGIKFSETGYAPDYNSKLIHITVLLFYAWTAVIFVRNACYAERNNSGRSMLVRFFFPETDSGRTSRNFALLVILDVSKVLLISSYVFFRALPYVTVISSVNALFLIVYALYAVVYVRSDFQRLSARFKIIGSVFIFNILIFSTMGYVALSQFESSYDDKCSVELRYLANGIRSRDFTSVPDEVDYIVKFNGTSYSWLFTRNKEFIKPQTMELNDFTPGRWRLSNSGQKINPDAAQTMKRYLVQINNVNYNQYIISLDGNRYGVGYDYYLYRKTANSTALILILIAVISSIVILLAVPYLISFVKLFSSNDGEKTITFSSGKNSSAGNDEKYSVTTDTYQKIKKAEEYINENYMYDISREGAAEAAGMSPGRFGRAFLTATGKKFSGYINDVRIEKAKVLLEGDKSIIEIAYSVGFESLSTFSRAFDKNCRMTPSAFRDLHQKK